MANTREYEKRLAENRRNKARAVVKALGWEEKKDVDEMGASAHMYCQIPKTEIVCHIDFNSYQTKGKRLIFAIRLPHPQGLETGHFGHSWRDVTYPKISVDIERNVDAITAEVKRRLLPEALAAIDKVKQLRAEFWQRHNARENLFLQFANILEIKDFNYIEKNPYRPNEEAAQKVSRGYGDAGNISIEPDRYGGVQITLSDLSRDTGEIIAATLHKILDARMREDNKANA